MSTTDDIQLPNQVQNADMVRAKRGLPAIDSSRIEGFGEPQDAPVPEYKNPYPEIPAEIRAAVDTPTRTFDEARTQFQAVQPVRESLEIWYEGSKVAFNESLNTAVEKLILAEARKQLDARLKELSKPKQKTRVRVVKAAVSEAPKAEVPAPRKRGRPKGSPNKPKAVANAEAVSDYVDITA